MRNVKWGEIQSSGTGDYERLEAGSYVGFIVSMEDNASGEYVNMLVDIFEGPRKGYFSDAFYANKPWAHRIVLSYKDKALGMLKGRLETIAACNPGFDPFAAWDAGRLDMFAGRKVGLVFRSEEYWDKNAEEFKVGSPRPDRIIKLEAVPTTPAPEPKMLDDAGKVAALVRAGYGQVEAQMKLDEIKARAEKDKADAERAAYEATPVPFL